MSRFQQVEELENTLLLAIQNMPPNPNIIYVNSDYQMRSTDYIINGNTKYSNITITLPPLPPAISSNAVPVVGNTFQFYVTGSNNIIIKPYNENGKINGKSVFILKGTNNGAPNYMTIINNTTMESITSEYIAPSSSSSNYPWSGGQINGYYMWVSNFVGSSPATQYYFTNVASPQQGSSSSSNLVSGSGTFNYYSPSSLPTGFNSLFLFSGYSDASSALSSVSSLYTPAYNYLNTAPLSTASGTALLGLCFGGGNDNGAWNTGSSGAIYSIYKAVTKSGVSFSYTETASGLTLSGTGTGSFNTGNNNNYNCLVFDIENYTTTSSSAQDFINLFKYIKTSLNSCFYNMLCIIIVTMSHSCSNYNGQATSLFPELYGDTTGSYDYLSPQLYTQNDGTMNEYCANYQILWTGSNSFVSYVSSNTNYQYYGNNFLLPSLNYGNLLNTSGSTETSGYPNLYFYQSSGNSTNPPVATASGWVTIPYTTDTGATQFFNSIFGTSSSSTLGGYAQWVNGSLS